MIFLVRLEMFDVIGIVVVVFFVDLILGFSHDYYSNDHRDNVVVVVVIETNGTSSVDNRVPLTSISVGSRFANVRDGSLSMRKKEVFDLENTRGFILARAKYAV